LKDAAATAIYGGRAAYGVILIESKKYRNEKIRFNLTSASYYTSQPVHTTGRVYAVARKFYAPKYDSHDAPERTDFRETVYWNPVVQTDKNGNASVSFYNSDASTTFRAIAEGIGYNGKPGRAEQTYTVRNAMSVDAKIPPYLTVGDKALIPLVIKNNSVQPLTITVGLRLPANLLAHDFTSTIILTPDSARQILIPVEATAALNGIIAFIVESPRGKETLELPVSAADKGFPVIQTAAGNKSAEQSFIVNQMIPGSLKANLKLFKDLEGQLLDGIESMLREPGGCFEQTSSSTYPNIYILKYLRASGKSNPAIEEKALRYIENGYRRLIGFETAQNGFEWFGKTPPHEALTAYGLLEFTDMQEFVNVDKQMLARTKTFLMNCRDGNGSFKHASGGYDQFASVPDKIADIYIVYALTQAGIGSEIQPEYQAAVKKALQSNDGYQLSMMALAASNMKNDADYRQLMNALDVQFHQLKLAAQTSVVNSRDASLRVETTSLYALALMREPNPSIGAVAEAISKILGEKTYYGYGSTQATV
ncbi:MAG TPA: alpha-2-macroglobulin family protein, partial [Chitinophagaceae bacterium]|nr:alpha-2-macroglobulin family protein [Chitinophagaceae bacterium]